MRLLKFNDTTPIFNIDYITSFKVMEAPYSLMKENEWISTIEINIARDACYQIHVPETREDAEYKLTWMLCNRTQKIHYLVWENYPVEKGVIQYDD